ncbi:MAG: HAD-IIB family hydrolase [Proteobacteria bacterium]|nr:HAD-IIB family hydrolase [Pseudomonadota bacterium]
MDTEQKFAKRETVLSIMNKRILATDLDGTFLHGSEQDKKEFYAFLQENRQHICTIFVTGRTIELIKDLYLSDFNFVPNYIIADHGTVIVHGSNFEPLNSLQSKVVVQWEKLDHDQLLKLLNNESSIVKQPFHPPFRHAYYYQSELIKDRLVPKIEELGFECIASSGIYLDILPKGFNKGTTLLHLLDHLEVDHRNVVTAGDSLNDLPLFKTGLASIAVGNSEVDLLNKVSKMSNVFISKHCGVSGIVDGLANFRWLTV